MGQNFNIDYDMDKINMAFNELATREQKILFYLLELEMKNLYVCNKMIIKLISESAGTVSNVLAKLEKKGFVEKINICPFCQKEYAANIPLICDNCTKRIIPETVTFKDRKYWPRYLSKLKDEKRTIILNFIRYFCVFGKRLKICSKN